jgi:hypothetical protein
MTTPLSKNFEKATVVIKDKIPSNKMTSRKAPVSRVIEITATADIKLIPIVSRAITRSGMDGPLMTLNNPIQMEMERKIKAIYPTISSIILSPP